MSLSDGPASQERLFEAIEFAARAHRGQFRKGTQVPYILHPLRVAEILIEVDAGNSLIVAALLHDTIEDTGTTAAGLAQRFGAQVAALVAAVSEPDQAAPWEERKQHTIELLSTATTDALMLLCADKLDNVRSMRRGERSAGPAFWERFHRPRPSQAWYYQRVALALCERAKKDPLRTLAGRLQREVNALFAAGTPSRSSREA